MSSNEGRRVRKVQESREAMACAAVNLVLDRGLDRVTVEALGTTLEGTGAPLVVASGTLGLAPGRVGTERDLPDPSLHPRVPNALATLALAEHGVRASIVRFAPTVHGDGDHGFITTPVGIFFYLFELLLVANLQAFIFAMLSGIYIGFAVEPPH